MRETMATDRIDEIRARLTRLQDELAAAGMYSMMEWDGETWHFIAGSDERWANEQWRKLPRQRQVSQPDQS